MSPNGRQRSTSSCATRHGELSDTAIREHLRERDARLDLQYGDRLVLRTGAEPVILIRCYALSDDC